LNLEHGIWTLAVCVIAGMVYERYRTYNPVWIIWFAMFIPDGDFVVKTIWEWVFPYKFSPIVHGSFHNIGTLLIVSGVVGWYIWKHTRITFFDASFCVAIGFASHLVEDALVNGTVYQFYMPFSDRGWYQGFIIHSSNDIVFAHNLIASSNLVYIGLALLAITILVRCNLTGYDWLKKYNFFKMLNKPAQKQEEIVKEERVYGNS
jgi:hypothetical protein